MKKLSLKKDSLRVLSDSQLQQVVGATAAFCPTMYFYNTVCGSDNCAESSYCTNGCSGTCSGTNCCQTNGDTCIC
jgi:hypothetical protein